MVEYDGYDDILASQSNKSGEQETQLGRQGLDFETLPVFNSQYLNVSNVRIRETKQQVSVGFVVGDVIYGVVGSAEVGPLTSPVITTGVYGQNNFFPEIFSNNRFIDTDLSTGSWNNIDKEYLIYLGSSFISTPVYQQNTQVLKNIKLDIDSENNSELQATIDIGSSYSMVVTSFNTWININDNVSDEPVIITIENISAGSNIALYDYTFRYTT